jgi:hypothetical protein
MKKLILFGILLLAGWAGFEFFSAYLDRTNFVNEVDSLLQTPREIGPANLPGLIVNKARERGIDLDPDEIDVRVQATDTDTELSSKFEGKGFSTENRKLDLHFQFSQTVMGITRTYSMDRERTFTARVTPPSSDPSESDEIFE